MTSSVVVPTFRRVPELGRCLTALEAQLRPPLEVIVTVRDTDAETREFLAARTFGSLRLRVVEIGVPGVIAAMNAALVVANGEIIALTDDDAAPWPDWLERINAYFEADPKLGGLGGRDWQYYDGKLHIDGVAPKRCGQLQWFGRVSAGHHLAAAGSAYDTQVVKGVNCAYRAAALRPIGFDARLLGSGAQVHWELSLGLAVRRAGWKIVFDPSLAVDHFPAGRYDEDQRKEFNAVAKENATANETLILLDHFRGVRRALFLLWAFLIGTRGAPGLTQMVRLGLTGARSPLRLWRATLAGRWRGIGLHRQSARPSRLLRSRR
jgi:GT2 family glycosyltransferase